MEAWIKVYHDLSDHPKTYALADALKVEQFAAVGIVVCLWTWAIIHAPDGDLERFPDAAIARACHWHKPAAGLAKALQDSGFLDGRRIHEWDEYASALIDIMEVQREKARKRVEAYRERKRAAEALRREENNVSCNDGVTLPVTLQTVTGNADVTPGNALRTRTRTRYIEDDDERAREEPLHNYEHSEIGTLVSTCLKAMTPRAWEEMKVYMGEMPEDLIAWAVQTSCEHGGNNWSYVSAVLRGLQSAGIKTVEEAEKRSEEHRRKRQQTGRPSGVVQVNYEQREYEERKEGELPAWLREMMEEENAG